MKGGQRKRHAEHSPAELSGAPARNEIAPAPRPLSGDARDIDSELQFMYSSSLIPVHLHTYTTIYGKNLARRRSICQVREKTIRILCATDPTVLINPKHCCRRPIKEVQKLYLRKIQVGIGIIQRRVQVDVRFFLVADVRVGIQISPVTGSS